MPKGGASKTGYAYSLKNGRIVRQYRKHFDSTKASKTLEHAQEVVKLGLVAFVGIGKLDQQMAYWMNEWNESGGASD